MKANTNTNKNKKKKYVQKTLVQNQQKSQTISDAGLKQKQQETACNGQEQKYQNLQIDQVEQKQHQKRFIKRYQAKIQVIKVEKQEQQIKTLTKQNYKFQDNLQRQEDDWHKETNYSKQNKNKNRKPKYVPKSTQNGNQNQPKQNSKQLKQRCQMKDIIPQGDLKRFIKLCSNTQKNICNLQILYSQKRPLIFCSYEVHGEKKDKLMGDIVHEQRINKLSVDIQLFWRTYDLLYKQVPEQFWGISKFGIVRAEEKQKFWAKIINIYKHKQLLKLYYVQVRNQIHFLLLHKQFRRVQFSSSYIEDKKLKYPHQYQSLYKFKKFLNGQKLNEQIEGQQQVDSQNDQNIKVGKQKQNQYQIRQRLNQILNMDMEWLKDSINVLNDQLYQMEFNQKRLEVLEQAKQLQRMMKQFLQKCKQVKQKLKSKNLSSDEIKLQLKLMVIAEKQLQSKLPIVIKKKQIFKMLQNNNIFILEGQTGSGKSTQLPQMLCEYYNIFSSTSTLPVLITQPRKIAVRSLASRVAEQMQQNVHQLVDYQTTANKKVNPKAKIIFKLDRIVLEELTEDPLLSKYCCLIVDEAHERTISIDVILGRLKNILQKRKDFKIIITSASMDAKKFTKYFNSQSIKIPGRLYPIEQKYEPIAYVKDTREKIVRFLKQHIFERDLSKQKDEYYGHILVFCPGIEDVENLTYRFKALLDFKAFSVLSLHVKLSPQEQKKVFKNEGKIKVIFATKIAETSITIDGIKVVIDPGVDKELVYDQRTKISSYQLKLISVSQATQRAGRAGRTGPGFCFHLYSEQQKSLMLKNKIPQIVNMPSDAVVLRLKALSVANIYTFPFLDPPKPQNLEISIKTLQLIGCLDFNQEITQIGKVIVKIPIQPFLARSIIQSFMLSQAFNKIQECDIKWISEQQKSEINIVNLSMKLLCILMNFEDLLIKSRAEQQFSQKQLILKDYELSQFQGEFDLLLKVYEDYQQLLQHKKQLKKWAENNKISLKCLNHAKESYEQIKNIFEASLKQLSKQKIQQEISQRKITILQLKNFKQLILACIIPSFINYLSLYSDVPQLGYTIVTQKLPALLDETTVLERKYKYPKFLICYGAYADQFNRMKVKIAQPVTIQLMKKVVNEKIFNFLNMKKIQQFNPYYHKINLQIPSLIFNKVVSDYKKRNFDSELQFLLPFTFIIDQHKNSIKAYHISSKPIQQLQIKLQKYIKLIKKPLSLQFQYNWSKMTRIKFNKNFDLSEMSINDCSYGISLYMPKTVSDKIIQQLIMQHELKQFTEVLIASNYSITTTGRLFKCFVQSSKNLQKLTKSLKSSLRQKQYGNISVKQSEKLLLVDNQNAYPELNIILQFNYLVDTADVALVISFCEPRVSGKMELVLAKSNIQELKYINAQHDKNRITCYFYENSKIDQDIFQELFQKQKVTFTITTVKQKIYQLTKHSNDFWIKKLNTGLQTYLNSKYYKTYNISEPHRTYRSFENKKCNANKKYQLQKYLIQSKILRIQFKITSRSRSLLQSIESYSDSILRKDVFQNKINDRYLYQISPSYKQYYGNFHVKTKLKYKSIVHTVPTNVFEALQNNFYQICENLLGFEVVHCKSQQYRGIQNTDIIIKYQNSFFNTDEKQVDSFLQVRQQQQQKNYYGQIPKKYATKQEFVRAIKKFFIPYSITVQSKYISILRERQQSENKKLNSFIEEFQSNENYQLKILLNEKTQKVDLYCAKSQKTRLQQKLITMLSRIQMTTKSVSYSLKGLNSILLILSKNQCQSFFIDYKLKSIAFSATPQVLNKIEMQITALSENTLKQCLICCQKFVEPYRLFNCNHTFCQRCLKNSIMKGDNYRKCPQQCQQKLNIYDIKRILVQQQFNKLCDQQVRLQIDQSKQYFFCYTANCEGIISVNYTKKQIKINKLASSYMFSHMFLRFDNSENEYTCKKCKLSYCKLCKAKAHTNKKCLAQDEFENQKQLLKLGIKKCPQCGNGVQKSQGCNHMQCKCGAHFCWKCGQSFLTSEHCYSHLNLKHGGIYDDFGLNYQIQQIRRVNYHYPRANYF